MTEPAFMEELSLASRRVAKVIESSFASLKLRPNYLFEATRAYPMRAGKMLRPALLLWSCGLFDEDSDRALPVAAAVELFHTWTLVHDDIIDQDATRRGGPSAHALVRAMVTGPTAEKFGVDMAILAGDVQQAWANRLILGAEGIEANLKIDLLKRLNGFVNPLLISGEAMDVEFELRPFQEISTDEMETMLRYKTALLLRYAAESGAQIGRRCGLDDECVLKVGDFAESIGLAFQLRDDILGMFGDEAKLGKPVGSDLEQGKRTYLFALTLERLPSAPAAEFATLLGSADALTMSDLVRAQQLIRESGALETVEGMIANYAANAVATLNELPANNSRELLLAWADFACNRDK